MLDLTVGIIIKGTFGTIVSLLVKDVVMPPLGLTLESNRLCRTVLLLQDCSAKSSSVW